MADAPASSGGSGWGVFEVILGIVLAIALISNINGKPITPIVDTANDTETVSKTTEDSNNRCGLSITAPLSLEKVSTAVHLAGLVSGCNWQPDGQTALFAQVINGGGVPISDYVAVQNNNTDIINTAFDTAIVLNSTAKAGTGYLILIPAKQTADKPLTVRIPIRIVRN